MALWVLHGLSNVGGVSLLTAAVWRQLPGVTTSRLRPGHIERGYLVRFNAHVPRSAGAFVCTLRDSSTGKACNWKNLRLTDS